MNNILDRENTIRPSPITISSVVPGDRQAVINWTDPNEDFNYVDVSWVSGKTTGKSFTKDTNKSTEIIQEGVENLTVTGLSNGTNYSFTFVTVDNQGMESSPITATITPQDLSSPDAVAATAYYYSEPDGIVVSWTDPSDSDFDHVMITWSPGGATGVIVPGGTGSYLITGLDIYNTNYDFTLVGVDDDGNQSSAVTVSVPLLDIIPPGKAILTGLSSGYSTITLDWTDPGDSDLDYIRVDWTPNTGSQNVAAGTETVTITGLSNSTEHTITVVSVDTSGNEQPVTFIAKVDAALTYYFVYTAAELDQVRNDLSGYHIIMEDIDLSGYSPWTNIGSYPSPGFTGTLQGVGHVITGLTLSGSFTGLFGFIDGGSVKNVNIDGFSGTGGSGVGAIAGAINNGAVISDCHVRGVISGANALGGLVGLGSGNSSTISRCSVDVTINGNGQAIGGLAGTFRGTLTDSYARGTISNTGTFMPYTGGLFGNISTDNTSVINCYASVSITCAITGAQGGLGIETATPDPTITGAYYDIEALPDDSGLGTLLPTVDMKNQATYTGWDFTDTWGIDPLINDGYPYLRSNLLY
jgi:hypothetical protein